MGELQQRRPLQFSRKCGSGHESPVDTNLGLLVEGDARVIELAVKRPGDLSTQVGCDNCDLTISQETGDYRSWLCESCAANAALAKRFDPTDYGTGEPPRKKNRTR